MSKFNQWLAGGLVLQLAMAALLLWQGHGSASPNLQQNLLAFERGKIDRVVIDSADQQATLALVDGQWQLPDLDHLPASNASIDTMLNKLARLSGGWPVTNTSTSHERLQVAEDRFERRLRLYTGDKLAGELLLGKSPGFQKVYARLPGKAAVYEVPLSNYELPDKDQNWLDKSLLAAADVSSIKAKDFQLAREHDSWQLVEAKAASGATLDADKAGQLAKALTGLRVTGVAAAAPKTEDNAKVLEVGGKDQWTYRFIADSDKYYVQRSDLEPWFSLSAYDYQRVAGLSLADLEKPPAEQPVAAKGSTKDDSATRETDGLDDSNRITTIDQ